MVIMKRIPALVALLVVAGAAFLAGTWYAGRARVGGGAERKILYYVDPMNPALTSDKPGVAPCGMPLEPVYADEDPSVRSAATKLAAMPPGTVRIGPEKQQLIGVRIGEVEKKPLSYTLRMTGRVAVDETRLYRVTTVTEGWVRELTSATTGSFVRKNQVLGAYYSQEVQGPQQAYLYALEALDRFVESGTATPEQIALNKKNVQNARQALRNLGMGEVQLDEIAVTRKASPNILIRAPADGIILQRNITMGQQFDRTLDLFLIADLSKVWILADAFEGDAQHLLPGSAATVIHPVFGKSFPGRVSDVPPVFDTASRTLKVRLVVDNPGSVLRPDMFVDVELPITAPDSLIVPMDAVLDSGSAKTVFVDRGEGFLEPRSVETGWRVGDQVQIVSGLMPGERIVVSGNFLIDSESRMKAAVGGMTGPTSKDPICGMDVDEASARAEGRTSEYEGRAYFFCGPGCKQSFDKKPASFLKGSASHGRTHD
jgi:membrane fusion protein, copper/silver efflux system